MMTRMEAIQDIRCGRGICASFVGLEPHYDRQGNAHQHTFSVIIRRDGKCATAIIDCSMWGTLPRSRYGVRPMKLTWRQVLTFIRLHYPRHSGVELNPISHIKPLARVA